MSFALLITALLVFQSVEGRVTPSQVYELERPSTVPSKKPVKTIYSEDGDIVDCIDIYAQPAFDDPILKNHKIQVGSTFVPKGVSAANSSHSRYQSTWRKRGSCPQGTVPMIRTPTDLNPHNLSYISFNPNAGQRPNDRSPQQENAFIKMKFDQNYGVFGASAYLNVWNPRIGAPQNYEFSAGFVAVFVEGDEVESLFAGWIVYPGLFNGDLQTRLYVQWQNPSKVCLNLLCGGFIQTSTDVAIGQTLPVSTYMGQQSYFRFAIYKDLGNGNWIFSFNDEQVGYWPSSPFKYLSYYANSTLFGGAVRDTFLNGAHTITQMGSGVPPNAHQPNFGKSSFAGDLRYMNGDGDFKRNRPHNSFIDNGGCYDLVYKAYRHSWKDHIFFGGAGLGPTCS